MSRPPTERPLSSMLVRPSVPSFRIAPGVEAAPVIHDTQDSYPSALGQRHPHPACVTARRQSAPRARSLSSTPPPLWNDKRGGHPAS
jgi:hypothetical protein